MATIEQKRSWNQRGQDKRRAILEEKARAKGWDTWSAFCTAVKRGEIEIPQKVSKK